MLKITKWIYSYWYLNERWAERNDLHSRAVQQAAADKLLFSASGRSAKYEMRYPE